MKFDRRKILADIYSLWLKINSYYLLYLWILILIVRTFEDVVLSFLDVKRR